MKATSPWGAQREERSSRSASAGKPSTVRMHEGGGFAAPEETAPDEITDDETDETSLPCRFFACTLS